MNKIKLSQYLIPLKKTNLQRYGSQNDGGYLLSENDVLKSDTLISLGIHENWDFEKQICENYKIKHIILFDPETSYLLIFKYLLKSIIKCNLKKIVEYIKKFKKFKNLKSQYVFINKKFRKDLVQEYMNSKNILLKIDIEGDEYDLLDFILNYQENINCLVIEFHNVHKHSNKIESFISKFTLNLIHTHVNTFSTVDNVTLELTFSKYATILDDKWDQFDLSNLDLPNYPTHKNIKIYN